MTELLSEVFSVTELNNSVLSDFNRAWILVVTIAVVILLCLAILALIKGVIFYIYLKCSNEKVQEAISALQVLGYSRKEIEKALEKVDKQELSVEEMIKTALKNLAR